MSKELGLFATALVLVTSLGTYFAIGECPPDRAALRPYVVSETVQCEESGLWTLLLVAFGMGMVMVFHHYYFLHKETAAHLEDVLARSEAIVSHLIDDVVARDDQLQRYAEETSLLNHALSVMTNRASALEDSLRALEGVKGVLEGKLAQALEDIGNYKSLIAKLEAEINQMAEQNAQLVGALNSANGLLEFSEKRLNEYRDALEASGHKFIDALQSAESEGEGLTTLLCPLDEK